VDLPRLGQAPKGKPAGGFNTAWIAALIAVAVVALVVVWRSLSPHSCLSIASAFSLGSSICTRPPGPKARYNPTEGTGKRLHDAARNSMDDEVRDLSTEWAGNAAILNFKDSTGKTALFWACSNEYLETAAILITTSGVGVNEVDDNGQSPLWIAAYECNREIVGMLLSVKGINTNQASTDRDYKDYTPIDIATKNPKSKNGCAEVVGQLKKAQAPAYYVYPSGPKANWTPPDGVGVRLYDAADNGRVDEVSE
jgi:Ankyrin repeats (3 copies)